MKNEAMRNLEQYIDHEVVDRNGNPVGTLSCLWSDHSHEPAYLGVKTGWLFGKNHVVPAEGVEVNKQRRTIRLPYTVDKVKEAPSYDVGDEIDDTAEREVRAYYNLGQNQPAQTTRAKSAGATQAQAG